MTSLKGHLLLASPDLLDPNFARSILLMIDHDREHASGVILNRPTSATIADISEQVFDEPLDWDKPLHLGGPVVGPLMVIHTDGDLSDREVLPGIYSTIDADRVRILLTNRAEPTLIVANYAGWGPGQLEAEIKEGSWRLVAAEPGRVFGLDDDDWEAIVREIDANQIPRILGIDLPADPSLN